MEWKEIRPSQYKGMENGESLVPPQLALRLVQSPRSLQDDSLESIQHCLVKAVDAVEDATTKVVNQRESCSTTQSSSAQRSWGIP